MAFNDDAVQRGTTLTENEEPNGESVKVLTRLSPSQIGSDDGFRYEVTSPLCLVDTKTQDDFDIDITMNKIISNLCKPRKYTTMELRDSVRFDSASFDS